MAPSWALPALLQEGWGLWPAGDYQLGISSACERVLMASRSILAHLGFSVMQKWSPEKCFSLL